MNEVENFSENCSVVVSLSVQRQKKFQNCLRDKIFFPVSFFEIKFFGHESKCCQFQFLVKMQQITTKMTLDDLT